MIDEIFEATLDAADVADPRPATECDAHPAPEPVPDIRVPVSVLLGHSPMAADALRALGDGSVVELDRFVGEPARLLVAGQVVARGRLIVLHGTFALHITDTLPPADSLEPLDDQ